MQSKLSKDGSIHVTDEKINTISHLAAAIFSILGAVLLIVQSSAKANPWAIVSFSIYGVSLVGVFFASALHHGVNSNEPIEAFLRQIDYIAIFPLIAGTFTPICLILYRTIIGWSIFGVIWALAGIWNHVHINGVDWGVFNYPCIRKSRYSRINIFNRWSFFL